MYRVYQDSAMVTQIIRSIFLEPLMFFARYLFALAVVAAFDPLLALLLGLTVAPILLWAGSSHRPCGAPSAALGSATANSRRGSKRAFWAFA